MYRFNIVPIKIAISDSYGSIEKQNKTTTTTKEHTGKTSKLETVVYLKHNVTGYWHFSFAKALIYFAEKK